MKQATSVTSAIYAGPGRPSVSDQSCLKAMASEINENNGQNFAELAWTSIQKSWRAPEQIKTFSSQSLT